jgi:hypothetical protein
MHAVCYSWSMDVEAKDDVYSKSTRLYMLEVALQEAKKERMAAGNSMSRSLEITHDDDRSCQFPDRPLRCIDPLCQSTAVRTFVSITSSYHSCLIFEYIFTSSVSKRVLFCF